MKVTRRKFLAGVLGTCALLLTDALVYEPKMLVSVERIRIPAPLDKPFRLVQLSDIHLGSVSPLGRIIPVVEDLEPDIVVITGDIFSNPEMFDKGLGVVEELSDLASTFIVYGNWDYWCGVDLKEFESKISGKVLKNSHAELKNGVCLAGVDDPYTGRDKLENAISGFEQKGFTILLAHSPQIIGKAKGKVDLVLSGHTHGGQVTLPALGPLYVPLPKEYRRYSSGLNKVENTFLYVNRGIGTSVFPARFACPPEVTLITLSPALTK